MPRSRRSGFACLPVVAVAALGAYVAAASANVTSSFVLPRLGLHGTDRLRHSNVVLAAEGQTTQDEADVDYEAAFSQRLREVKKDKKAEKEEKRKKAQEKPPSLPVFGEMFNDRAGDDNSGKNFLSGGEWNTLLVLFGIFALLFFGSFVWKASSIPGFSM
eukprot:TRINITY_DN12679_c0_g1_i1.p1 TRINITY_DN12679_c0_g1~~TRINITY_DN12679_c0_g1_i1.p1  ORF type:complete len:188 (-),score=44.09 TRINITY_DN12679_c0_g1_i1:128-607(-)